MGRCRQHAPRPRCSKTPSTCRYGWRPTGRRRSYNAASAIVRSASNCAATTPSRGYAAGGAISTRNRRARRAHELQRTRRLLSTTMAFVGAIVGVGVALTAFHYDGTRPVNVVTLLAALVVFPSVLLLATLLLLPSRVGALRAIQNALATINPGAVGAALYRRLAQPPKQLAPLFGWHQGRSAAATRFGKWQLLYWSQVAAVALFAAVITTGDRARHVHRSRVRLEHDARRGSGHDRATRASDCAAVGDARSRAQCRTLTLDRTIAVFSARWRPRAGRRVARTRGLVAVHDPRDRHLRSAAARCSCSCCAAVQLRRRHAGVVARRSTRDGVARSDGGARNRDGCGRARARRSSRSPARRRRAP